MEAGNGTTVADDARSAGRSELAGQLLHLSAHRAGTAATFLRKSLYSHDNRRPHRKRDSNGPVHTGGKRIRRQPQRDGAAGPFPHHTKPNRMSLKLQSFGPIADKHSRVLVLGTMPGAMSLAKRQYYGHPRNAFWPIMARLCDRELPEDYALRKAMLLDAGIALWDVCGECEREGSLDSNICHEKPNRIDELLRSYPSIRAIAFNGQGAARLYRKHFGPLASEYGPLILPSSSPAHAVAFDKKLDGWMRLRDLLVPADEASRP